MARQFDIREPSIDALKAAPVYFRYGSNKRRILIDGLTAQAVLAVYNALQPDKQEKVARMIAASPGQLEKVVSFAWKVVRVA